MQWKFFSIFVPLKKNNFAMIWCIIVAYFDTIVKNHHKHCLGNSGCNMRAATALFKILLIELCTRFSRFFSVFFFAIPLTRFSSFSTFPRNYLFLSQFCFLWSVFDIFSSYVCLSSTLHCNNLRSF